MKVIIQIKAGNRVPVNIPIPWNEWQTVHDKISYMTSEEILGFLACYINISSLANELFSPINEQETLEFKAIITRDLDPKDYKDFQERLIREHIINEIEDSVRDAIDEVISRFHIEDPTTYIDEALQNTRDQYDNPKRPNPMLKKQRTKKIKIQ